MRGGNQLGEGVKNPTRDLVLTGTKTSLKEEEERAGWWEGGGEEGLLWQPLLGDVCRSDQR